MNAPRFMRFMALDFLVMGAACTLCKVTITPEALFLASGFLLVVSLFGDLAEWLS